MTRIRAKIDREDGQTGPIAAVRPSLYDSQVTRQAIATETMRKALKFLHTLAACGLIGALLGYMILLISAPQDTASAYADMRQSISALCNYLLLPSLGLALVSGVLSMVWHLPFLERGWVWLKAVLGLSMFEGTLVLIVSRAEDAARISAKITEGDATADTLNAALANEWQALAAIMALSIANIVLGIWRPPLKRRQRAQVTG